jgi:exosortase/archaeosortase family protein
MNLIDHKKTLVFLAKFLLGFSLLYYGTIAMIGLATPGNYYSPFIDHYFGYYRWLRNSLLYAARFVVAIAGFEADIIQPNLLKLQGGRGVKVGYDCLGYGVISFWLAFVFADNIGWKKMILWMAGGVLAFWIINVIRISLVFIAINKNWAMPLGWDHHTWFNIVTYALIAVMIFMYDKINKT